MTTEPHDIADDFPNGVNTVAFQRAYAQQLIDTAGFNRRRARQLVGGNSLSRGVRSRGTTQLYTAGTYNIEIGDLPIDPNIRLAVDRAIADQQGETFMGPVLAEFDVGQHPGEQRYAFDGTRRNGTPGLGALVYWDGDQSWRYVRDDRVAVTPS